MKTQDLETKLKCKDCKEKLSVDKFSPCYRDNSPHEGYRCIACESKRHATWYTRNKEYAKEYMRTYRKQVKDDVFNAYGGYVCACCGEDTPEFLDIDHINNDGAEHRRKYNLNAGTQVYVWIRNNGYPKDFQVLCANCNRGKFRNGGVCPHQNRKITMSHSFESSGPGDSIMELHRPDGHAHLDQKFDKGNRTPWLSQFPQDAGLASPEVSSQGGSGHSDSGYSGGGA